MIEFFFDCSSPWTYLAFHNIQPLAKEFGEEIVLAADPGRRHLQQSIRASMPRGSIRCRPSSPTRKRTWRTGRVRRARDQDAADGVSGEQRQGDARLHSPRQGHGAVRARGVRDLLGRGSGHLTGRGADRSLPAHQRRSRRNCSPASAQQAIKDQLKANTDEVMARGGFGSRPSSSTRPTCTSAMTDCHWCGRRWHGARRARPDAEGRRLSRARAARALCGWKALTRAAGGGASPCRDPRGGGLISPIF